MLQVIGATMLLRLTGTPVRTCGLRAGESGVLVRGGKAVKTVWPVSHA